MNEDEKPARLPADSPALSPPISIALIALVVLTILFVIPRPATVAIQGWRMLAIFVATVLALTLRPIPGGAAVLFGVVATMLARVLTPAQALAGYSNTSVWLVVAAFLFSRA